MFLNFVILFQVNVPFDFHRSIIGQKGRGVRELMDRYDVHIVLSPADQQSDVIEVMQKSHAHSISCERISFSILS